MAIAQAANHTVCRVSASPIIVCPQLRAISHQLPSPASRASSRIFQPKLRRRFRSISVVSIVSPANKKGSVETEAVHGTLATGLAEQHLANAPPCGKRGSKHCLCQIQGLESPGLQFSVRHALDALASVSNCHYNPTSQSPIVQSQVPLNRRQAGGCPRGCPISRVPSPNAPVGSVPNFSARRLLVPVGCGWQHWGPSSRFARSLKADPPPQHNGCQAPTGDNPSARTTDYEILCGVDEQSRSSLKAAGE